MVIALRLTCVRRTHALVLLSPGGVQPVAAVTQSLEPSVVKTPSSRRLSLVVMRVALPICAASGGVESVEMARFLVVTVRVGGAPVMVQTVRVVPFRPDEAPAIYSVDDEELAGSMVKE